MSATRKGKVTKEIPAKPREPSPSKVKGLAKRDLARFKRLLEEEQRRLLLELEGVEEIVEGAREEISGMNFEGYDEDLADFAVDTFEREKGLVLESSIQDMLAQVEAALKKIEEGTYGICERCGQPISLERLEALPWAKLCISCKALEEKRRGM
ncbi:MAG: TraR/DksA C4-type zinc finger protein [Armatimonadota bacterium]|nr:TraR/DksA C4-type zinc finger protein [Armatimonadota bacterium]MDR5703092.1 TraR/DksA C4-type zinc finger protein [Armatimonadota bacterium]MDR7434967.1 TraR/DksA C4-type zinc finger protein [Armatimonadota bacterium]